MKKLISHVAVSFAIFISIAVPAHANFYNVGSLEMKPISTNSKGEWFIEYLNPDESVQRKIEIANMSNREKKIELYVSDSIESEETTFLTQSSEEIKKDEANIAQWVSVTSHEVSFKPYEKKTVDISFTIPAKAGIGLHKGALIAREITKDKNGNDIRFEKGIRVYLNILGQATTSSYIKNESLQESYSQLTYDITTVNNGTTDIKINHTLALEKIWGGSTSESSVSKNIKPKESFSAHLSVQKPDMGIYNIVISKNNERYIMKTIIVIPWWSVCSGFIAISAALIFKKRVKKITKKISLRTIPQYRKGFAYWGVFMIMTTVILYAQNNAMVSANTQLSPGSSVSDYKITMRWGNVRGFILPHELTQDWNGKLNLQEGTFSIQELAHFERNDMAEVVDGGQAIELKTTTGPDNDGMTIKLTPSSDAVPVLSYTNRITNNEVHFTIHDISNQPLIIPYGLFSLEIKSEPIVQKINILEEREATAEAEEEKPESFSVPELQNLFVEEIPATPEVLEDFILESDYVKDIKTDKSTSKVEADPILIKALEEAPEILDEVTQNSDVNYIFIPTETVSFPPQEFSFTKAGYSTQEIGNIIFVQNKNTSWNTYVSTTDFSSLSGKGRIPASALTIVPGEAKILTEEQNVNIQTGSNKNFRNTSDKTVLVNVNPNGQSDEMFVLNPRLEIRIPAGTLPGKYRGSLTITTL